MLGTCPLSTRVPRLDRFLYGTESDAEKCNDRCFVKARPQL